MATAQELQMRLTEAELALHRLMTGTQTVMVRYGEKHVTYTAADVGTLSRYVNDLRGQLAACTGQAVAGRRRIIQVIPGC